MNNGNTREVITIVHTYLIGLLKSEIEIFNRYICDRKDNARIDKMMAGLYSGFIFIFGT